MLVLFTISPHQHSSLAQHGCSVIKGISVSMSVSFCTCSHLLLQENLGTEAVSNEKDIKINLDQSCADTESSDDLFSDGETKESLQSAAKSSSGYHSGSSTDMSETVQPEYSMYVYATAAASHSHDLKQVDETVLGSTEHTDSSK